MAYTTDLPLMNFDGAHCKVKNVWGCGAGRAEDNHGHRLYNGYAQGMDRSKVSSGLKNSYLL